MLYLLCTLCERLYMCTVAKLHCVCISGLDLRQEMVGWRVRNSQTLSERCLCGPEIVTDSSGRNCLSYDINIFILIPTYCIIITGFMSLSGVNECQ